MKHNIPQIWGVGFRDVIEERIDVPKDVIVALIELLSDVLRVDPEATIGGQMENGGLIEGG